MGLSLARQNLLVRVRRVSNPFVAGQWGSGVLLWQLLVFVSRVSNPFVAGQWGSAMPRIRISGGLLIVSNPFVAGQWGSDGLVRSRESGKVRMFQTPSLRGNGAQAVYPRLDRHEGTCFKPLRCGAMGLRPSHQRGPAQPCSAAAGVNNQRPPLCLTSVDPGHLRCYTAEYH